MSLSLKQQLNSNATDLNGVTTRVTAAESKATTQGNQINDALVSISSNSNQINAVNAAKQDKIRSTNKLLYDFLMGEIKL
jgi:hypothetical protein